MKDKADWIRNETIKIHKNAPETRIASCLSCVEILTVLYYKILKFDPLDPNWEHRDRLIISKAHGSISLYPILSDLGFLCSSELINICKKGSKFGSIPDCSTPGIETINGSLGHGLGIACGIAIGLRKKLSRSNVFVLMGDGELWEGSTWEAISLAGHHKLDNLILIIDNNKKSMLGYTKDIIDLDNNGGIERKFNDFGWYSDRIDGHNVNRLYDKIQYLKIISKKPKVLICDTIKGKGVKCLENNELCHVMSIADNDL